MTDDLHTLIVDTLEQAAFRGEWSYDPNLTALEAAVAVADLLVPVLR